MLEILTDNNKTFAAFLFNDSNLRYTLYSKYHNFGLFWTIFGPFFDVFYEFKKNKTFLYIKENTY